MAGGTLPGGGQVRREAQLLASLNHPNIAAIYGLEEENGVQAIALELVEGPTLAERIKQGALPLDDLSNTERVCIVMKNGFLYNESVDAI